MKTLGLLLASLLVALLLAELGVRAFWDVAAPAVGRPAAPPTEAEGRAAAELAGTELPELHSLHELGQPGARGVHKGLPFRNNRSGFRGPEYSTVPAADVFRIALAGDSITMGTGVLEEDAYAARLEAHLNQLASGVRYEVLNLGLSGLNATQVAARVRKLGSQYAPHLLVYGYTMNDIQGPAYVSTFSGAGPARFYRYRRFLDSPSYLLRAVWPRLLALWEMSTHPVGTLEHDLHSNYFDNEAAWAGVERAFDDLAAHGGDQGVCLHLLVHTGIAQLNRLYPFLPVMEKVEAAARARGFSVTQSFPYFEGRDPTQLRLSAMDPHPNAAGHEILASALLDGLRDLPEHCWSAGPGGRPVALAP